jgi:spermidine/putrescine transport system permease protein
VLLGYPTAYAIAKMKPKSQVVAVLMITLPTWINMLVRTYAWRGILDKNGLINQILSLFGIAPVKLLETSFAVVLGMVYNFIPFMILQIYNSLSKLDHSLLEAADDLGANRVQAFLRVTLPLSVPGIISGITLVFLPAVSSFFIPKLLGGGQYVLIGNVIENQFLTTGKWGFGSAISLIMSVIIVIAMYIARRIDRSISAKGGDA